MGMFDYRPPALKFNGVGDRRGGRVTAVDKSQRRAYRSDGSGGLLFWQDRRPTEGAEVDPRTGEANDPVMQWVIIVETGEPDQHGETERSIYFGKQRLEEAFSVAAKAVKLRSPDDLIGWELFVTKTGSEQGKGAQPADTWAVELIPSKPGLPRPVAPSFDNGPAPEPAMAGAPPLRNHESSPVLNPRRTSIPDEPPF